MEFDTNEYCFCTIFEKNHYNRHRVENLVHGQLKVTLFAIICLFISGCIIHILLYNKIK